MTIKKEITNEQKEISQTVFSLPESELHMHKTNSLHYDMQLLDIDQNCILWVNDKDTLNKAQLILCDEKIKTYGLDVEMVSMNLKLPNKPLDCQTLQISTSEIACIFDLQAIFMNESLREEIDKLLCHVFCESNALKIGMSFGGDLKALKNQMPECLAFHSPIVPYLDLALCLKHIREDTSNQIPADKTTDHTVQKEFQHSKKKEGGLAKLARWVLGKKLDKDEQLSNWSLRPLRATQLKYGALDSLCECWLYERLSVWANQHLFPDINGFLDELYCGDF